MPNTPEVWLPEFQVNTIDVGNAGDDQNQSVVLQLTNGNIVVLYEDDSGAGPGSASGRDIVGQMFSPEGQRIGDEFLANRGAAANGEFNFDATALPDGRFVVTFVVAYNLSPGAENYDIRGVEWTTNANGVDEYLVRTYATSPDAGDIVTNPSVAAFDDGGYVVAYEKFDASAGDSKLVYRLAAAAGPVGPEIIAVGGSDSIGNRTDVTVTSAQTFALVYEYEGADDALAYRVYDSSGTALIGANFVADTAANGDTDLWPTIAARSNGGFVIAWQNVDAVDTDIEFQRYMSDGTALGSVVIVDGILAADDNRQPHLIGLADDNDFIIAYNDQANETIDFRRFSGGSAVGETVTAHASGEVGTPSGIALADGRFVVGWTQRAGGNSDVGMAIFDPRDAANPMPVYAPVPAIIGTVGDDTIVGTGAAESIQGWKGNDTITGGNGNDTIRGDGGKDDLRGNSGNDLLYGGSGSDELAGGSGTNSIDGGSGHDFVFFVDDFATYSLSRLGSLIEVRKPGERTTIERVETFVFGDRQLTVNQMLDEIAMQNPSGGGGGPTNGDDVLFGTPGNDTIDGLGGNDTIYGLTGRDLLDGSQGFDVINGGGGDDTINGGAGFDTLNGGAGNDVIKGNAGNDVIDGGIGADTLDGGLGADRISGKGGNDSISGGDGFDLLFGNAGNDDMKGNNGNDTMYGGQGFDVMDGGLGADLMFGDAGFDTLFGKGGNDTLFGGAGDDTLYGNAGNDVIDGGTGNDLMFGGQGADRFVFKRGYGQDTIADMQKVDTIVLGAGGLGIANAAQLAGLITETPAHWQLDFGGGDVLTVLKPMAGGALDAGDFVLG